MPNVKAMNIEEKSDNDSQLDQLVESIISSDESFINQLPVMMKNQSSTTGFKEPNSLQFMIEK